MVFKLANPKMLRVTKLAMTLKQPMTTAMGQRTRAGIRNILVFFCIPQTTPKKATMLAADQIMAQMEFPVTALMMLLRA